MSAAKNVLHSFLTDALRMSAEASECVKVLAEQASRNQVSPAQVRTLYQVIHTLKGTASMVQGGHPIVESLHQIEGRLTTQTVLESARRPDWILLAKESIDNAHKALMALKEKERMSVAAHKDGSAGTKPGTPRGILARTQIQNKDLLLWFPLNQVGKVLGPEDLGARDAICLNGVWVPVVGAPKALPGLPRLGLAIHSSIGKAVIAVQEILGILTWSEAAQQGAKSAVELLSPPQSSAAKSVARSA